MDKKVIDYLLLHGHDLDSTRFKVNKELAYYMEYVTKMDKSNNNINYNIVDKETIIKKSKAYLNKYFKLHDVGFLNNMMFIQKISSKEINSNNDLIDSYNDSYIEISPFNIPINTNYTNNEYGALLVATPKVNNHEILKNVNVYFLGINLGNNVTDQLIPIYIHEIIHTQLESNKGIICDIKNKEVLSIFIQLLYTYQNNINEYRNTLNRRLNELMENFISLYKNISHNKDKDIMYVIILSYLVSSIKAFKLFDTYINSNIFVKKSILKSIQKVFDADLYLEEFLDKYEITYDNSLDPKVLKRITK